MQSCCARTIAFGDLRTVLGLRSDVYAGRVGDLLRHIHEEDQKRVLDGIAQARDSHTPYSAEFRVVRDDQSTRWVSARGRFEYSETGKPRRMRGMAVDISERNRADDLRKAYDINQRLALLAVNLDRLKQELPRLDTPASERLDQIRAHVSNLGSDVQTLSPRLHSSKLEYWGIVAAASSLCRELSEQQNVKIDFQASAIPKDLP